LIELINTEPQFSATPYFYGKRGLFFCKKDDIMKRYRRINMASSKEYVDYILEQLSGLEEISCRSMMGEYIVYYREKIAAYICDERFLVKPTAAAKALLPSAPSEPPYEGAKEMLLVEDVDDKELLQRLFKRMYDELPAPRHKGKKGERQ
jgi:tfoX N-domain family protein